MSLYFIAIEPPAELSERVREIQLDFKTRFDSEKSYHSFPHLTLVPPFRHHVENEHELVQKFLSVKLPQEKFMLQLNGFGNFAAGRRPVIFLKPEPSEELMKLRNDLSGHFSEPEPFFNPHVTVAYKDLSPDNFKKAWEEYAESVFFADWFVSTVILYRHNNRKWNPIVHRELKNPE